MKVKDLMTPQPLACASSSTLGEAARLMWEGDCGILPVVEDGSLAGVVTDRDMFIALATQNARAAELTVGAVAHAPVVTCAPEDDVHTALAAMKAHRVRRLPVVGLGGTVLGMVSMNDLLLAAAPGESVTDAQVVEALQTISAHPVPVPVRRIVAA